jgi:hypothetical protein
MLAAILCSGGCVLLIDTDETVGHACLEGRCLPGFRCIENVCVEDPGGTGIVGCEEACTGGRKCDLRTGTCEDVCEASVCPTGHGCVAGGTCESLASGLGAACGRDADCAGAIPGCTTDPDETGRVRCACLKPATGVTGICLGIPSRVDDCAACGETAICLPARYTGMGSGLVCAPGGFRLCDGDAACSDPDNDARCTYLGWPADPDGGPVDGAGAEQRPLGLVAACATPSGDAGIGEACQPGASAACASGLCVSTSGGAVCSVPCGRDRACAEMQGGRCLSIPFEQAFGQATLFAVAPACGEGPTLGAPCTGDGDCGSDAPTCLPRPLDNQRVCTRTCRSDDDCPAAQGFTCRPELSACF